MKLLTETISRLPWTVSEMRTDMKTSMIEHSRRITKHNRIDSVIFGLFGLQVSAGNYWFPNFKEEINV